MGYKPRGGARRSRWAKEVNLKSLLALLGAANYETVNLLTGFKTIFVNWTLEAL